MTVCARPRRGWPPALRAHDVAIYSQADGLPRHQLLENFKADPRAVLLGTDSFWQGVDVPGEALQNVIITKLPFSVPDQPLLQARLDAIRAAGGNPFQELQLPEAIIKLRQGFGRLIRTRRDRGIVVILDPRISTRPYGNLFLESLPACRVVRESAYGDDSGCRRWSGPDAVTRSLDRRGPGLPSGGGARAGGPLTTPGGRLTVKVSL